MPRKIRELIAELEAAGFINHGGKGSHRVFKKKGNPRVIIAGKPGDDAHAYQERDVKKATGGKP